MVLAGFRGGVWAEHFFFLIGRGWSVEWCWFISEWYDLVCVCACCDVTRVSVCQQQVIVYFTAQFCRCCGYCSDGFYYVHVSIFVSSVMGSVLGVFVVGAC